MSTLDVWSKHTKFAQEKYNLGAEYKILWMGRDIDVLPDGIDGVELKASMLDLTIGESLEKHAELFSAPSGWILCGLQNEITEQWVVAMINAHEFNEYNSGAEN